MSRNIRKFKQIRVSLIVALSLLIGTSLLAGNFLFWHNTQKLNDSLTHAQCDSLAAQILVKLKGLLLERADDLHIIAGLLKNTTEPVPQNVFLNATKQVLDRAENFTAVSYMSEQNITTATVAHKGILVLVEPDRASKDRLDDVYEVVGKIRESKASVPLSLMWGYYGIIIGTPLRERKDETGSLKGMIAGEIPIDSIIQKASVVYDPSDFWIEMTISNVEIFNSKSWGAGSTHHLQKLGATSRESILGQVWQISVYPRAGNVFLGLYRDSTWRFVFNLTISALTSFLLVILLVAVNKVLRSRELLSQSELRYRILFNDSPLPLWEEDFGELYAYLEELKKQGVSDFNAYFDKNPAQLQKCVQKVKIMDVNKATIKLHRANSKEELLGNLERTFTDKSYNIVKKELIAIALGQLEFESEAEVKTLEGEPRDIFLKLIIDKNRPKSIRGLLATVDITERKQAEKALRKSEEKYRSLIQRIQAAVVVHDADTKIIASNPKAQELLGLTQDQMLGKKAIDPDWKFLRADGALLAHKEYPVNQVMATRRPLKDLTAGVYRPDIGDLVWTLVHADPVLDDKGEIQQVIVTFVDITDRKRAEEALHLSLEKFQKTFWAAPIWVVLSALEDGRYIEVNENFLNSMGYKMEEVIGKTSLELNAWVDPRDRDRIVAQVRELGGIRSTEVQRRTRSGAIIDTLFSAETFRIGDKPVMISVSQDITERKRTEEELKAYREHLEELVEERTSELEKEVDVRRKAERQIAASLAEKEVLLREIHHRVKNNLNTVSNLLYLQSRTIEVDRITEAFQESRNRIQTMARVHELLHRSESLARIDMNTYLKELTADLAEAFPHRSALLDTGASGVKLEIDRAIPCGLIVTELVSNSLKHAFATDSPKNRISVELSAQGDDCRLVVTDNGCGLPEGLNIQQARSLGLRLVEMLTRQLHGNFEIQCAPGQGTRFCVSFDAAEPRKEVE